jgi:S-DNA-T family DNA segregation ATPase FtsK/SpoIIIE
MLVRLTARDDLGRCHDLIIDAPSGTTAGALGSALSAGLGHGSGRLTFIDGRCLPVAAVLGGPGLREGCILQLGRRPVDRELAQTGPRRLDVVNGPGAGLSRSLRPGSTLTIGRSADCGLQLDDQKVSRIHASLLVTADGARLRDLGSANGTRVGGRTIGPETHDLAVGELIEIGDTRLAMTVDGEPALPVSSGSQGEVLVAPMREASPPEAEVEFPSRRSDPIPQRIPWLGVLLPAALGGGMTFVMHDPIYLAFSLLSPATLLATTYGDRARLRRRRRVGDQVHEHALVEAESRLAQALTAEIATRCRAHPDPATVARSARTPDIGLWVGRDETAALTVRLGLGAIEATTSSIRDGQASRAGELRDVPVTVSIADGPVGILTGSGGCGAALARWIVSQLVTRNPPDRLRLALLLHPRRAEAWRWTRWLPHLDRDQVATTGPEHRGLLDRFRRQRGGAERDPNNRTWSIFIVDCLTTVGRTPGLADLFDDGNTRRVSAVCLDSNRARLEHLCPTIVHAATPTAAMVTAATTNVRHVEAVADAVSEQWADSVARSLAPLRPQPAAPIPVPLGSGLIEMLNRHAGRTATDAVASSTQAQRPAPTVQSAAAPEAVLDRWRAMDRSIPIGMGDQGPITLNLDEDGPHLLVAGTTGSGKSEFLRGLVASCAYSGGPADIAFVLIDYKGGAAFADCAALPHVVGLVTDLDVESTTRVLRSLAAEIRRREQVLAAAHAPDFVGHRASTEPTERLTRLMIIVDEYAALVRELPDFVAGLVDLAQRGRSLGLHLVLATQRPTGVVSTDIRANITLRLALRVTDATDSLDIIDSPAAAELDQRQPGLALLRSGHELIPMRVPHSSRSHDGEAQQIKIRPLDTWGRDRHAGLDQRPGARTELQEVVDAIRAAWKQSGSPVPRRPWRDPLPHCFTVHSPDYAELGSSRMTLGLVDLPDQQDQAPLTFDLDVANSAVFVGGSRSGRTTTLRSVATACAAFSPGRVKFHVIDCAGGSLTELAEFGNCQDWVDRSEPDRIGQIIHRLAAEVRRRQDQLGSLQDPARWPSLVLLVDSWDGLGACTDPVTAEMYQQQLLSLVQDGPSVGLTSIVTADRSVLVNRLWSCVTDRFVLPLNAESDYGLAGLTRSTIPSRRIAGRAVRVADHAQIQLLWTPRAIDADPVFAGRIVAADRRSAEFVTVHGADH